MSYGLAVYDSNGILRVDPSMGLTRMFYQGIAPKTTATGILVIPGIDWTKCAVQAIPYDTDSSECDYAHHFNLVETGIEYYIDTHYSGPYSYNDPHGPTLFTVLRFA